MVMKHDTPGVDKYINSVVGITNSNMFVLLLRIYDNGMWTSAGFVHEIIVEDEPVYMEELEDVEILFHASAATELPDDMFKHRYVFTNDVRLIMNVPAYRYFCSEIHKEPEILHNLIDVDLEAANELATTDNPVASIEDNDNAVFRSDDGCWYSWCLLCI